MNAFPAGHLSTLVIVLLVALPCTVVPTRTRPGKAVAHRRNSYPQAGELVGLNIPTVTCDPVLSNAIRFTHRPGAASAPPASNGGTQPAVCVVSLSCAGIKLMGGVLDR